MKHYYIKQGEFYNTFTLRHVEAGSDQEKTAITMGYERITRKEAIARARNEREARSIDPNFAYYGDDKIFPFDAKCYHTCCINEKFFTSDGYIFHWKTTLHKIFENLKEGKQYGLYFTDVPFPKFSWSLKKEGNYIHWRGPGESVNKATLNELKWIIKEVFQTTPEWFEKDYLLYIP